MKPLRQRMIDAMVLRGFSPRTQESYAHAIYALAKHYRRDPAQYSAQEVEAYLLHLINERHLSYSTMTSRHKRLGMALHAALENSCTTRQNQLDNTAMGARKHSKSGHNSTK